jgi:hypothetical protein
MNGTGTAFWRDTAGELAVMAGVALVLAILGPFGTFSLPFPLRLFDWLIFAIGGYVFFRPVIAAGDALSVQAGMPRWVAVAAACALASLPTTLLIAWAFTGLGWLRVTLSELAGFYPKVLIVGGIVTAVQMLIHRDRPSISPSKKNDSPTSSEPEPEQLSPIRVSPSAAFLEQLPPALGQDILCLENEDHYVRVHTALGSALLLMRTRDAVAALDDIDGRRIHRSWWVARAAVSDVLRRDRAVVLRLKDGQEVPVSRAMAPELRAAGWL